jgi:hypothetical protein
VVQVRDQHVGREYRPLPASAPAPAGTPYAVPTADRMTSSKNAPAFCGYPISRAKNATAATTYTVAVVSRRRLPRSSWIIHHTRISIPTTVTASDHTASRRSAEMPASARSTASSPVQPSTPCASADIVVPPAIVGIASSPLAKNVVTTAVGSRDRAAPQPRS